MAGMTTSAPSRDPNLERVLSDVVAVVDRAETGELVIWHVDTGPDNGLARMAGAWVLDAQVLGPSSQAEDLLRGRRVLATAAGRAALEGWDIAGVVDPDATLIGFREEIATLQEAFDAEARKLVSPTWPALPSPLDFGTAADAVAVVLGAARWLEDAAVRWEKMEAQRVTRKFLAPLGGPERRPLHLRCR